MHHHLVVICVVFTATIFGLDENVSDKKLQIGIKKKVENCARRSAKGDILQMHYTVYKKNLIYFIKITIIFNTNNLHHSSSDDMKSALRISEMFCFFNLIY